MIRGGAADYVQTHRGGQATLQVQSVLAKLTLCRTAALGGRWYQCDDCSQLTKLHNSCGDRHCAACSGAKRWDWSDRAEKLLIDGVEYYQVVFTLPGELSALALGNRSELADVLFQSAWKALRKSIENEQGYDAGALMVLHTWNQKLDAHWHVHALVPAAGPGLSDAAWTTAKPPEPDDSANTEQTPRKYLVDAINLRRYFRKFALAHLERLRRRNRLTFGGSLAHLRDDDAWQTFVDQHGNTEWTCHIEPPRSESSRPEHVVRYLTRYLTGGPISDHRITHADETSVTILAREGKVVGGQSAQVPYTLPTAEFVRRWCLHIQSDRLTKTRQFGGWSNTRKDQYLARCRASLTAAGHRSDPIGLIEDAEPEIGLPSDCGAATAALQCEHCGSDALRLIKEITKPSWWVLLDRKSANIPAWYAESLLEDDRAFWDARMGAGYSDFHDEYLETLVEVAKSPPTARSPAAIQLTLPGIRWGLPGTDNTGGYETVSF